jgi:hypothetical protein
MSAPPKTVVKYSGLEGLIKQTGPGGSGVTGLKYMNPKVFGQVVRFLIPEEYFQQEPEKILELLRITYDSKSISASEQLTALINQRAKELPLPEGCAVIKTHVSQPEIWTDALSVLAILTKCTDTIWLRSKSPSLVSGRTKRTVSLLVPPLFIQHLPKV